MPGGGNIITRGISMKRKRGIILAGTVPAVVVLVLIALWFGVFRKPAAAEPESSTYSTETESSGQTVGDTGEEVSASSDEEESAAEAPEAEQEEESSSETEEAAADAKEELETVFFFDFEDQDVSAFTNRGPGDTTLITATTDGAASGTTALLASGRTAGWNGPAFRLDTVCEPDTEYYVSACLMGRDYNGLTLSFQYTDSYGGVHYSNLVSGIAGKGWQTVENVKVSFSKNMSDVYVYVEGNGGDIFLDDFKITAAPAVEIEDELASLAWLLKDDFKVGTALTPTGLSSKPVMALIEKHFSGSITPGNEMKPDAVLNQADTLEYLARTGDDENPQVSFAAAASVLDYCRENNIPMRIHTLVWHQQTPTWFFKEGYQNDGEWVSKEKMVKRMENFIKNYFETLTTLYPEIDFYACDVVNEAWLDDGSCRKPGAQEENGNHSPWVKVFGDNSFIEYAFRFARKYAPEGCKLYYNDYNEYMSGKVEAIVQMAESLKEEGIIDGIGMQSHLDVRTGSDAFPSVSMYRQALDRYASLGLDIQITELDATVPAGSGEKYYEAQAEYYKGIFEAIYAHRDSVSALIFWGVTDDGSWRASRLPCLFDSSYMAKPAYYAIVEGIMESD